MIGAIAGAVGVAGLGAAIGAYGAIAPQAQLFGRTVVAGRDVDEFALTFDDGPNEPWTSQMLDLLARHDIRATFFLIGKYVRQRPDLVREIQEAGHLIGNHTVTHPWLAVESPQRVREELAGCNAALEDLLGERVRFFRPPYGARRPDVLRVARDLGLTPVMWNAMGFDWRVNITAEEIAEHLGRGIVRNRRRGRGSNLLLHDGGHLDAGAYREPSIRAAGMLAARYKGTHRFVTLDAWC